MKTPYLTPHRTKKEADDLKVYKEYLRIKTSSPNAMATAVEVYLMKKFKIGHRSTVWKTIRRVEKRYQTAPAK